MSDVVLAHRPGEHHPALSEHRVALFDGGGHDVAERFRCRNEGVDVSGGE